MRRSTRRSAGALAALAWLCWAVPPPAHAADQQKKDGGTVRKTEDGLHFQLPPDWPIEKRGGVVGPIPVEEYVSRRFSAVEDRLRAIEQQLGGLDVRVRVLEEQVKKGQSGLKSVETP